MRFYEKYYWVSPKKMVHGDFFRLRAMSANGNNINIATLFPLEKTRKF